MNRLSVPRDPASWAGMCVAVLGLGRSGEAAAAALAARGARVLVLDANDSPAQRERASRLDGVPAILGREDDGDLAGTDLVVASPGIPPSSLWMEGAHAAGIPVWSEVELAYRLGVRPLVAITGTNGKTTATEMTAAALHAAGIPATTAGNIGTPLVETVGSDVAVVAEVSSFQLHSIDAFRTPVAVVLNVAADHLDWHGSFEAYSADKAHVFANQMEDDTAIVHTSCAGIAANARARLVQFHEDECPPGGAGIEDGWIVVPHGRVIPVAALRAPGRPNRADAVAAAAAACALGADPAAVGRGLAAYVPQPHRIEVVATVDDVVYVNDSKATDPHATLAALAEMRDVVLIAGGRNKGLDLSELSAAAARVSAVVAIGESAGLIEDTFVAVGIPVERAGTMAEAVLRARAFARAGDTVLLSPACASFDMFADYRARGEEFRSAVLALRGEEG